LPKDYRTLIRRPDHINTVQRSGGEFVDFGLENSIISMLDSGIAVPDTKFKGECRWTTSSQRW